MSSCEYLDVVALHDYNIDPSYVGGLVEPAKATATQAGKTLFYEEYGATGDNKQSDLQNIHKYLVAVSIFDNTHYKVLIWQFRVAFHSVFGR